LKELKDIRRILVIDLGGIGDLLLAQPALRALRSKYRDAVIDMFVVDRCEELVRPWGLCDHVFVCGRGLRQLTAVLQDLRRCRYDLVMNMRTMISVPGVIKMFALVTFIAGRITAGRDTDGRGFFFDIKVPETGPGTKHEMEYDIDTAAAVNAPVFDRTIALEPGNPEPGNDPINTAARILRESGVFQSDALIGIHPGGKPSHQWPLERYRSLMDAIHAVFPCVFVITGDAHEKGLAVELCRGIRYPAVDMSGRLSISETAALIRQCRLFISNDTGAMHIAAIVKTPQVAFFGPGYLARFDPRVISQKAVVLYSKTACAPCNRVSCSSRACLNAITVETALDAALKLLGKK